jgi:hypothetical protein
MVSINCFIERAKRSSFHTIRVSPLRANSKASRKAGRSVTAPDICSMKIFPHPASASASRCKKILARHNGDFGDFWLTADGDWNLTFDVSQRHAEAVFRAFLDFTRVSARGHVEGRREMTPDAKFCDKELAAEDPAPAIRKRARMISIFRTLFAITGSQRPKSALPVIISPKSKLAILGLLMAALPSAHPAASSV